MSRQAHLLEHFTLAQADEIIAGAGTPEYKQKLIDVTKMVVEEQGAFGCPWYWVTNKEGKGEPFFGSDRYVLYSPREQSVSALSKIDIVALEVPFYVRISGLAIARREASYKGGGGEGAPVRDIWQ